MPADYPSTARGLSLPIDEPGTDGELQMQDSAAPWRRYPRRTDSGSGHRRSSLQGRMRRAGRGASQGVSQALRLVHKAGDMYMGLSLLHKILLAIVAIVGLVATILLLRYREAVFAWLAPIADRWRDLPFGWAIIWAATFFVSFPPLIGYSSCVMVSGFVFGAFKGWLIVATATILGSFASFIVSRGVLSGFVERLVANDRRFTALSLTLKHDGLKLLIMIRLCPLPYSISNGAIASFPTVTRTDFFLATALATPKLLIHTFIGSRIAALADHLGDMDRTTKLLNYFSIALGVSFGLFTGWFVYRQTKRRTAELEAEEEGHAEAFQEITSADDDDDFDPYEHLRDDYKSSRSSRTGSEFYDESSREGSRERPKSVRENRSALQGNDSEPAWPNRSRNVMDSLSMNDSHDENKR